MKLQQQVILTIGVTKTVILLKKHSKTQNAFQETAKCTVDNAAQSCDMQVDPRMKQIYDADDRMLWHERLYGYFHMDTFCATKANSMKSISHYTCCKLFVTDKGHIHVFPLKKEFMHYQ